MKKISYILLLFVLIITLYITYLKADSLFFSVDKNKASKNEEVKLTLNLNNIVYDKFNVIITSNKNINTLVTTDIQISEVENNQISFDIDKLSMDIDIIVFNYKICNDLMEGDTVVFTAKITEINELNIINEDNSMTEYAIVNIIKIENNTPNDNDKPNNNTKPQTTTSFSKTSISNFSLKNLTEKVTYNGSDNNYLNSLSIKGYKLNKSFSKERTTYFVTVSNDTTKVKINYKKSSSKSNVIITGNTNLKVGINKVLVTVNAENGSSRVYRIYVSREGVE